MKKKTKPRKPVRKIKDDPNYGEKKVSNTTITGQNGYSGCSHSSPVNR